MSVTCEAAVSETAVDLALLASSFAGWRPDVVASRSVRFSSPARRIVHGLPFSQPMFECKTDFTGDVNTYLSSSGFVDPAAQNTQADFRWLPNNFDVPAWQNTAQPVALNVPVAPLATFTRSFARVAQTETWDSARRNETWATLPTETVDDTIPFWTPYGAGDPTKLPNYVYWRGGVYVPNQAVAMDGSQGLYLTWSPTKLISQMSVVVVVVPRAPVGDRYSLLTAIPRTAAGTGIEVVLNADSTVSLLVQDQEARTLQLSGRARPNEPIVVGLNLAFDSTGEVMMAVVDSDVRTTTMTYDQPLAYSDTDWYLNHSLDARMEVLEVDLYTNVASEDSMIRLGMLFNRLYGVTLR